jgi:ABC-type transport system substrate-binding protein
VRGDHVTLVRNEQYFKPGKPYLDRIVVRITPDAAAASIAFEKGEVDYFLFPPPHELARLRQLTGFVVTTQGREGFVGIVTLIPNLRSSILGDLKVRQAIAHAIDRGVILDKVYFGHGVIATGPISRAIGWEYNPEVPREAGLAFLGMGDPAVVSWGTMLYNAQQFMRRAWWLAAFPGLALSLAVLGINLLGDGFTAAWTPRLRVGLRPLTSAR